MPDGTWKSLGVADSEKLQTLFMHRVLTALEQKELIDDDIITYLTPKDDITHEFEPLEFLARLTPHIANRWESTTRYFGWYSSRTRGKRNKRKVSSTISASEPLQKKQASKRWSALIKRIFEVDPLVCPKCEGPMRIREFLIEQSEIKAILNDFMRSSRSHRPTSLCSSPARKPRARIAAVASDARVLSL